MRMYRSSDTCTSVYCKKPLVRLNLVSMCVCGSSRVCRSLYGYILDIGFMDVYVNEWLCTLMYVYVLCTYSRIPRGTTRGVPTCTAYMNAMWNGGRSSISNIIPDLLTSLHDVTSVSSFAPLLSLSISASPSLVQLAEVRYYIMPSIYLSPQINKAEVQNCRNIITHQRCKWCIIAKYPTVYQQFK